MISYHPRNPKDCNGKAYSRNWTNFNTTDLYLIAAMIRHFAWSPIQWSNGIRNSQNFARADYIALDFDSGPTVAEIANVFCDCKHILATTKSHQKNKNGIVCDRFRLVMPVCKTIYDSETYVKVTQKYIDNYDADKACKDAGRFFWPSVEIKSIATTGYDVDVPSGGTVPRILLNEDKIRLLKIDQKINGVKKIKGWLGAFLNDGIIPEFYAGRNRTCYSAAIKLLMRGLSKDEVVALLKKSPFEKEGFAELEYITTVNSAQRWLDKEYEKLTKVRGKKNERSAHYRQQAKRQREQRQKENNKRD